MNLDTADPMPSPAETSARVPSRLLFLWLTSVVTAAAGVTLLYDEHPGLNWTLWTCLAVAGFVFWSRSHGRELGSARATLLALACLLSSGAAMTGMLLLQLAIALGALMLMALAVVACETPLPAQRVPGLLLSPLSATAAILEETSLRGAEMTAVLRAKHSLPALRGIFIAAPIVITFFLLLSAADPTLADWRSSVWDAMSSLSFIPQLLVFSILGIATLGACGIAARHDGKPGDARESAATDEGTLGSTERLIVLCSVAALFALFLVLQLSYLFEDSGSRAGSGLTYADAARRGFFELTLTAALSAVLIVLLDRFARRDARERIVKYCALILIAELLPMLLSANSRIGHYESAYGYTLARLYVHVYIAIVCVSMLLLARQVLSCIDLPRLCRQLGAVLAVTIALLSFWNPAAWIVERNVERHAAENKLDVMYLLQLAGSGPDAIPALVRALPELGPGATLFLREALLRQPLDLGFEGRRARWYLWNLRRAQARAALRDLREDRLQAARTGSPAAVQRPLEGETHF